MAEERSFSTVSGSSVQLPEALLKSCIAPLDSLGVWTSHIKELAEEFSSSRTNPFSHTVIDNFFAPEIATKIAKAFPSASSSEFKFWHEYANPLERKLACNSVAELPPEISQALVILNAPSFVELIARISGIENLQHDPYLHGGGIHCHKRGGKLDMHLDYCVHPLLPQLERRLNLIVYVTPEWLPEYGGAIQLWDQGLQHCVRQIPPIFNRAVLFSTSDISYHGLPDPISCPPEMQRSSIASYYLSPLRPLATPRYKGCLSWLLDRSYPTAQFFPRPTDSPDELIDALRKIRLTRRIEPSDLPDDWEVRYGSISSQS